jgi:hypothetical protein
VTRKLAKVLGAFVAWSSGLLAQEGSVIINEIHYDPPLKTRDEEFIELYNKTGGEVDLTGAFFADGIEFTFPPGASIAPGGYLVVAENPADFQTAFGFPPDHGPYTGRIANDGERLVLRLPDGERLDEVDFQVTFPWPLAAGGDGSSMELIHPDLDNDLGGSWRASGYSAEPPRPPVYYLAAGSPDWHYRRGNSEASAPADAWRQIAFPEDGTWAVGRTPIGYGDGDDNTVLNDMLNAYASVYLRHIVSIPDPGAIPAEWKLRVYADDGAIVWLNGVEVARVAVNPGEIPYNGSAINHEATWEEIALPAPETILNPGQNILAVHALNTTLGSSDFSIDVSILVPGTEANAFGPPTPGAVNSVFSATAPPQVRQVAHSPPQPLPGDPFLVTCKVTDPDGVLSVKVLYQVVAPGSYVPAFLAHPHSILLSDPERAHERNLAFDDPASWTEIAMGDAGMSGDAVAGDDEYAVILPGQGNRTLVRYRIEARDTQGDAITVPYIDDRTENFALFVYAGVPAYTAGTLTVQGAAPYTYPATVMRSLPTYHLITRSEDFSHCLAYDGSLQIAKANEAARDHFNWEAAFVYDGVVYDHVRYRLRQSNDRYGGSGKRSFRFRFNKGYHLQAHDLNGVPYPTRWRSLNSGKNFDNKRVGNFGLTETMNQILWNMMGVPAPYTHPFLFRVIDAAAEAPDQYFGDFFGLALAFEDYDARFLESHGLEDGSLYKLKDQVFDGNNVKRHQGRYAVEGDTDFQNIRNNLRATQTDLWVDDHVRYEKWGPYHAVVEGIRHYDFVPADSHLKNRAWYFEPDYSGTTFGRLWTLPHDSDASWGPNWNSGIDYSMDAIYALARGGAPKPVFKQEYRNVLRSFRDLVWREEVLHPMIDDLAAEVSDLVRADRDRWRSAPAAAGSQDYGTMEAKVTDMKNFAFVFWSGSSGPTVPAGGRAAYLDSLANAEGDVSSLPATPVVTSTSPAGFPLDQLSFATSSFNDPDGNGTFAALEWRVGEVTDPSAPAYDPAAPKVYEVPAVWESGVMSPFQSGITIPPALREGHAYRVRVRHRDTTGRWSHWSAPLQLIAGEPTAPFPQEESLRITELMYNPLGGSDFEFVEIANTGPTSIDLTPVSFVDGLEFSFAGSDVTSIAPDEYVLVVRNRRVFETRYETGGMRIAGEYTGRIDNGGERFALGLPSERIVHEFAYDDAWHPLSDGFGFSLELIDPFSDPALHTLEGSWQASPELFGTPGAPPSGASSTGGLRLPGDGNSDGVLEISDAFALLRHVFPDGPAPALPCDGALEEGGNLVIFDVNDEGGVNLGDALYLLNYIFELGPAPEAGTRCIRVEGCETVCR